ncbi:SRPBCC family protein [Fictibacillus iocasae]|uniref:SRPBCC family protein n=1 Tax=Fictibacillus iocasae TaxID=2715437 RepID=A0ABW2NSJ9_9BACL
MITWHSERELAVSIEAAWSLFDDDRIQRILRNVVEHEVIESKPGVTGTTYKQSYKEGKRVETYTVTVLDYKNEPEEKLLKWGFVLGKAFYITFAFKLRKVDDNRTLFIYEGKNKGLNFLGRVLLKLGERSNEKVVSDFMDTVEREALQNS